MGFNKLTFSPYAVASHTRTRHIYHHAYSTDETCLQDFLELLGNLGVMFPLYYMHSDIFSMFKSSTTY